VAALPKEQAVMAVALAEQVTAVAEDLTAAPTRVQVLVAAMDLAVVAAEVQAAADQECGDCMRALFCSQDLAMVTVGEHGAAIAAQPTDVKLLQECCFWLNSLVSTVLAVVSSAGAHNSALHGSARARKYGVSTAHLGVFRVGSLQYAKCLHACS
jgi:hypothetical protein